MTKRINDLRILREDEKENLSPNNGTPRDDVRYPSGEQNHQGTDKGIDYTGARSGSAALTNWMLSQTQTPVIDGASPKYTSLDATASRSWAEFQRNNAGASQELRDRLQNAFGQGRAGEDQGIDNSRGYPNVRVTK